MRSVGVAPQKQNSSYMKLHSTRAEIFYFYFRWVAGLLCLGRFPSVSFWLIEQNERKFKAPLYSDEGGHLSSMGDTISTTGHIIMGSSYNCLYTCWDHYEQTPDFVSNSVNSSNLALCKVKCLVSGCHVYTTFKKKKEKKKSVEGWSSRGLTKHVCWVEGGLTCIGFCCQWNPSWGLLNN